MLHCWSLVHYAVRLIVSVCCFGNQSSAAIVSRLFADEADDMPVEVPLIQVVVYMCVL